MSVLYQTARRLYEKETKETLWSLATKGLAAVLFFLLNIYLGRVMGVERFGTWSFLLSALTVVVLLSYLGLNHAARAFTAQTQGSPALRWTLSRSIWLRLAISAIAALLFALLHERFAVMLGRPELGALFLLATPFVFLSGFVEYFKQVFSGLHRIKYHFIVNFFEFGLKIVLSVLLLSLVISLQMVILAHWLALLVAGAVGAYFWARFYRQPAAPGSAGNRAAPSSADILRYSLPLFLISIGFLILTEIDTLMLGLLADDVQVGLFAIGKQFANKLPQISLALAMGTMPAFARMDNENRAELLTKFRNILRLNSLVFLPLAAAIILFSPVVFPLLLSAEYQQAVLPLQILTIWILMSTYNIFFNQLLDYQGRARRRAVNFSITMAATVILNLLLIPRYGATGAAISTTVAYFPYLLLNWLEVRSLFTDPTA